MADNFHTGGLFGTGTYAFTDGQIPVWSTAAGRYVPGTFTRAVIAGGAAGDHTVMGIAPADVLVAVLDLTTPADLTSECTISATDTINNTGGTDTTGDDLLVWWIARPSLS